MGSLPGAGDGAGAPGALPAEGLGGDVAAAAASGGAVPGGATPWDGTDTNGASDSESVPLPATVFSPPVPGAEGDGAAPPAVGPDVPTALMDGGSRLPPTAPQPQASAPLQPAAGQARSEEHSPEL
ncbi:hypothetical protein JFN87_33235, partial [Streptomyces bomunensis]|nr:hypothetical protein [Streptomyces montanisoli]